MLLYYLSFSYFRPSLFQFWGDIVLDSFNMAYGDGGSIIDQKYENQIFWDLYKDYKIKENTYLKKYST